MDSNEAVEDAVDIVLHHDFAQPEADHDEIAVSGCQSAHAQLWCTSGNFHPDLIRSAQQQGAHDYLSKTLNARELVAAVEAVHDGYQRCSVAGPQRRGARLARPRRRAQRSRIGDPGLVTQGNSNAEVAALTYLSPNTVKSYIRTIYRKIGVDSRTQAVLWVSSMVSRPTITASNIGEEVLKAPSQDPSQVNDGTRQTAQ